MKNIDLNKYEFIKVGFLYVLIPKGKYIYQVATSKTMSFAIKALEVADIRIRKRIQ